MRINIGDRTLLIAVCCAFVAAPLHDIFACTRVLWNNNKLAVVVSRTMDWPESTEPVITVFPAGMHRDGGQILGHTVVADNPARWKSKYGSVVMTMYGVGTADGVNEKGLAAHLLFLTATDFGPRDATRAGVHAGLWGQYILDNAATVTEAIELMDTVQPVMISVHGHKSTIHMALEDASGDSAIFEYIDQKLLVHHGREHTVLTNDPTYDKQLANLAEHDFTDATRYTPLPGNVDARSRFVRAAYFLSKLPEPKSEREAIAGILAIARNASVPFGAPNSEPGTLYNTEYRTAIDLTNLRYFFELTTAPNVIWMDLASFNLQPGAPVLVLDPDDVTLAGDVTARFKKAPEAPF
jgi:choloylglycine hydrolase